MSAPRDEDVVAAYLKERLSLKEVGARFGRSERWAWSKVTAAGVMRRSGPQRAPTSLSSDEMAMLYTDRRMSLKQIGDQVGLSAAGIRKRLKAAGVQLRPPGSPAPNPEVEAANLSIVVSLYVDDGLSVATIAEQLNRSIPWVRDRLRTAEVRLRPSGGEPIPTEVEIEAIRLYTEDHLTIAQVAQRVGMSTGWVGGRLRQNNVKVRSRGKVVDDELIVRRYSIEGKPMTAIGKEVGIAQPRVREILEANNIDIVPAGQRQTRIDVDEVRRLYVDERLTTSQIADTLDVSVSGIRSTMDRHGIKTRSNTPLTVTPTELQRHLDHGFSNTEIAAIHGVNTWAVTKRIRDLGLRRPTAAPQYEAPPDEELKNKYLVEKQTILAIAEHYGTTHSTIRDWLERIDVTIGIDRPGTANRRDRDLTRDQLKRMYLKEELTAAEIAAQIGVTKKVVLTMLHENGIALRPSGARRPGNPVPLLDQLYNDASITEALTRHAIPLVTTYGNSNQRFPELPALTGELLEDLYNHCGLSIQMISLLVGHGEASIRSHMRNTNVSIREGRSRAPWTISMT